MHFIDNMHLVCLKSLLATLPVNQKTYFRKHKEYCVAFYKKKGLVLTDALNNVCLFNSGNVNLVSNYLGQSC